MSNVIYYLPYYLCYLVVRLHSRQGLVERQKGQPVLVNVHLLDLAIFTVQLEHANHGHSHDLARVRLQRCIGVALAIDGALGGNF